MPAAAGARDGREGGEGPACLPRDYVCLPGPEAAARLRRERVAVRGVRDGDERRRALAKVLAEQVGAESLTSKSSSNRHTKSEVALTNPIFLLADKLLRPQVTMILKG